MYALEQALELIQVSIVLEMLSPKLLSEAKDNIFHKINGFYITQSMLIHQDPPT